MIHNPIYNHVTFLPGDMIIVLSSKDSTSLGSFWIILDVYRVNLVSPFSTISINCPVCYFNSSGSILQIVSLSVSKNNILVRNGKQMTVGDIVV